MENAVALDMAKWENILPKENYFLCSHSPFQSLQVVFELLLYIILY